MKKVAIRHLSGGKCEYSDIRVQTTLIYDPERIVFYLEGKTVTDGRWVQLRMFWEGLEDKLLKHLKLLRNGLEESYHNLNTPVLRFEHGHEIFAEPFDNDPKK